MKQISLTRNKITLVDDEDFETLNKFKWYLTATNDGNEYAYSYGASRKRSNHDCISMHRFLMQSEMYVDHKNGNGLDNRRENLRLSTPTQNNGNQKLQRINTSGYKGVSRSIPGSKKPWRASIKANGIYHWLGTYDTAEQAHQAYMAAAENLFGEFARAR